MADAREIAGMDFPIFPVADGPKVVQMGEAKPGRLGPLISGLAGKNEMTREPVRFLLYVRLQRGHPGDRPGIAKSV